MRPTHLSRLLVRGVELDDLALLHCEWALGLDRFATLRESRLVAGIPADARPVDLLGEHGERWIFRFSVPLERGKRTSAVRLAAADEGVQVEHLVVHEGPTVPTDTSADSPETMRALIALPGVEPDMLRQLEPVILGEREVPAMVAEVLAPNRPAPLVLVSVDNSTREPLVDPHELARRLAGMVKVVWLSTVAASRRLKDELMARDFSEKFGCFHGGVRILWPGIDKGDSPYDHLLLLPMRLETIPARTRTERVAGLFCEMIAEDEDLRAWLREVDAPARPEPLRRHAPDALQSSTATSRTSSRVAVREPSPPTPTSSPPPPPTASIPWRSPLARPAPARAPAPDEPPATPSTTPRPTNDQDVGVPLSQAPLDPPTAPAEPPPPPEPAPRHAADPTPPAATTTPAPPAPEAPEPAAEARPRPRGETAWSRLAGDVVAAAELAEELEDELEELRHELAASRKAQRRAEQERDEATEARFTANTVAEAVALAEACFPDRLVVLPSARASAAASPFRDPSRIFQVLALLAFFGRHDGELETALEKVLGAQARWRPRDSPETSARFGAQRTWADRSGTRKPFRRHITLGHGVDAQRCAQVYYDVTPDGRVELAWVGEHRPTVSEDT